MLHYQEDSVRERLLEIEVGLEKENLRVTGDGHLADTADPFPDDPHIVKDFSESQVEINTDPWADAQPAIAELSGHTRRVQEKIRNRREAEYLWPFSNPPYLTGPGDVPIAQFLGKDHAKTVYREYLSQKYGTYLMTFSGIHLNLSFSENLLRADFAKSGADSFRQYKDQIYLALAEQMLRCGWILNILTSASPVLDGSYFRKEDTGKDVVTEFASVRCGEKGYWNTFVPVMDYDTTEGYAESIGRYVDNGLLWAPSELYFPIRLKAGKKYTIEQMKTGWTHFEIRTFDLNPLVPENIEKKDVEFAKLLMVWLVCQKRIKLGKREKERAVGSFKRAARLYPEREFVLSSDGKEVPMLEEARRMLDDMLSFYSRSDLPVLDILEFEQRKLEHKEARYAFQVLEKYTGGFVEKGMKHAIELSGGKGKKQKKES